MRVIFVRRLYCSVAPYLAGSIQCRHHLFSTRIYLLLPLAEKFGSHVSVDVWIRFFQGMTSCCLFWEFQVLYYVIVRSTTFGIFYQILSTDQWMSVNCLLHPLLAIFVASCR